MPAFPQIVAQSPSPTTISGIHDGVIDGVGEKEGVMDGVVEGDGVMEGVVDGDGVMDGVGLGDGGQAHGHTRSTFPSPI